MWLTDKLRESAVRKRHLKQVGYSIGACLGCVYLAVYDLPTDGNLGSSGATRYSRVGVLANELNAISLARALRSG